MIIFSDMAKATTSSYITEIPLKAGSREQAILKKRFWSAKQQYNALLGEALKRLRHMRDDNRYGQAIERYKQEGKKSDAKALFKQLADIHGYREYDLHSYCKQWNNKGNSLSIGSRISQKIANRAFNAAEAYRKGTRGKPRFKGYRGLASIEGNSIDANLRLKENTLHYLGLKMPLLNDVNDPIHNHGLNARIKYVRLVRRSFNGRTRYFAQLVCEGQPFVKPQHKSQKGIVGLDIGPQTIAIVSHQKQHASLKVFADELKTHKKKKRKLERKIARRLRLNNPEAYEENRWVKKDKHWHRKQGKAIKGKRSPHRSKRLQKSFHQLADMARRKASHRKTQHGQLVNEVLQVGTRIRTDKLNYKAFQKMFGSSVGLRAPSMFVEKLRRKAANAGGKVEDINTFRTKLSQACHCGRYEKKKLATRWHKCPCGVKAQRDLFSAYLACFVEKDTRISGSGSKGLVRDGYRPAHGYA